MCFDLQCGHESAREDTYLDIPLVIRPFGSTVAYGSVVSFVRKRYRRGIDTLQGEATVKIVLPLY